MRDSGCGKNGFNSSPTCVGLGKHFGRGFERTKPICFNPRATSVDRGLFRPSLKNCSISGGYKFPPLMLLRLCLTKIQFTYFFSCLHLSSASSPHRDFLSFLSLFLSCSLFHAHDKVSPAYVYGKFGIQFVRHSPGWLYASNGRYISTWELRHILQVVRFENILC